MRKDGVYVGPARPSFHPDILPEIDPEDTHPEERMSRELTEKINSRKSKGGSAIVGQAIAAGGGWCHEHQIHHTPREAVKLHS